MRARMRNSRSFPLAIAVILGVCRFLVAQAPNQQPSAPPVQLTLKQAEQFALTNNPQISVSQLLALAQQQVLREVRSTELPNATGNLTAVDAYQGTRITAGVLNNPSV